MTVNMRAAAADVDDQRALAVPFDLAVNPRHGRVGEARRGGLATTDLQGLAEDEGEGPALVGARRDEELRDHRASTLRYRSCRGAPADGRFASALVNRGTATVSRRTARPSTSKTSTFTAGGWWERTWQFCVRPEIR